jgi:hypothetical protein
MFYFNNSNWRKIWVSTYRTFDTDIPKKIDTDIPKKIDTDIPKKIDTDIPKKIDTDIPKKIGIPIKTYTWNIWAHTLDNLVRSSMGTHLR